MDHWAAGSAGGQCGIRCRARRPALQHTAVQFFYAPTFGYRREGLASRYAASVDCLPRLESGDPIRFIFVYLFQIKLD